MEKGEDNDLVFQSFPLALLRFFHANSWSLSVGGSGLSALLGACNIAPVGPQ